MTYELSDRTAGSTWPTGQGADMVSEPATAMTAPGSLRAVPRYGELGVATDRTEARPLVRGASGGSAVGRRDDVSGHHQPWR